MKMQSVNAILLFLLLVLSSSSLCSACRPLDNSTPYFCSKNFHNILHWRAVKPAFPGQKVVYSVSYTSYKDQELYKIKAECHNITKLACDLTKETPSIHDTYYLARVHVNGELNGTTIRFKPIATTIFGPPTLNNYTQGSLLYVEATLPSGPEGSSMEKIINRSKHQSITIHYTLQITSPPWATETKTNTEGKFTINMKNKQAKYCGNVFYGISSERGRPDSEPAYFCVSAQDSHNILLPWPLMGGILFAAIIIITVVGMCIYVRGGKKKIPPLSLWVNPSEPSKVLQVPDDNLVISKLTVCERTEYATIRAQPHRPTVGCDGYSPQVCDSWQSSIGSSGDAMVEMSQDTSSQSSDNYGSVAVQTAGRDEGPTRTEVDDGGIGDQLLSLSRGGDGASQNLTSHGITLLPVCEHSSGIQLLLHTVRDSDGRLTLPSLPFQSMGSSSDLSSPLHHERKPLLSDLIDSKTEELSLLESLDSMESGYDDSCVNIPMQPYCNSHYLSSKATVPCFQRQFSSDGQWMSGYKQNWTPAAPPETQTGDDCPIDSHYRGTNFPSASTELNGEEEEEEEEEGDADWREESSPIHLGGWMVQIQE